MDEGPQGPWTKGVKSGTVPAIQGPLRPMIVMPGHNPHHSMQTQPVVTIMQQTLTGQSVKSVDYALTSLMLAGRESLVTYYSYQTGSGGVWLVNMSLLENHQWSCHCTLLMNNMMMIFIDIHEVTNRHTYRCGRNGVL